VRGRILARNHVLYEDPEVIREFERFFEQAVGAAASRPAPGMKVAVVTPYCMESEEVLLRCHQSVLAQSYSCVHFLVADGRPADFTKAWQAVHIALAARHDDNGNTPRAIGSLAAVAQGFDAIAYLDADNWFQPDHIASLAALHRKTGAAVCASGRTFHRLDGSLMPIQERGDGAAFVDTSCLFLTREAFRLVSLWALMPKQLSPICDRVFWQAVVKGKISRAQTGLATAAFRTRYAAHYRALREAPPAGAHPMNTLDAAVTWWRGLSAAKRKRLSALMGFSFHPKESGL
jgi:glycosyltransferase involved in cell wall biosynthesis